MSIKTNRIFCTDLKCELRYYGCVKAAIALSDEMSNNRQSEERKKNKEYEISEKCYLAKCRNRCGTTAAV